jgi:hypothetical protein
MSQSIMTAAYHPAHSTPAPNMDVLMVFGFFSMFLALVFLLHQHRSRSAMLGLSACLFATSIYGFLQGAWPLGVTQLAWAGLTLYRWQQKQPQQEVRRTGAFLWLPLPLDTESRMSAVFETN